MRLKNLIIKLTNEYHDKAWMPFIKKPYGKWIEKGSRILLRILYVFEIVSPPKKEAPCFTYIFIRYPNKFHRLSIYERITYLKKFIIRAIRS